MSRAKPDYFSASMDAGRMLQWHPKPEVHGEGMLHEACAGGCRARTQVPNSRPPHGECATAEPSHLNMGRYKGG